jgi:hypothetical protein
MNDPTVSKITDISLLRDKYHGRLFPLETAFSQVNWATKHGTILIPIAEVSQMKMVLQATRCNSQRGAVLRMIMTEQLTRIIIVKSSLTWFTSLGILPSLVDCY